MIIRVERIFIGLMVGPLTIQDNALKIGFKRLPSLVSA
jgi:hypothetical protein